MSYSYAQIEQIWISNGGDPASAPMAAAIAMAESKGDPNAINSANANGTTDRGLWQINSIWGSSSSTDLATNAQAAVRISKNGSNWQPWSTYGNGAYQKYLQGGVSPSGVGIPAGGTSAGGTTAGGTTGGTAAAPAAPEHSGSTCALGFKGNIPVVPQIYTQTLSACIISKPMARAGIAALLIAGGGVVFVTGALFTLAWGAGQTSLGKSAIAGGVAGRTVGRAIRRSG